MGDFLGNGDFAPSPVTTRLCTRARERMGPAVWGYFQSFLVPLLDNFVSKGNLARADWTYGLATLVCAPSSQKHFSYSPFTRYGHSDMFSA